MDNKQVNKAPQKSARLVLQAVTAKISNKYKQGVGTGSCNLIFTKSGYNSTNTQVGMGMENYQSQLSTAFVSGNVDFR